jgi:LSD1 subclass zinc finger protein
MQVTCSSCQKALNIPDNAGGKQVRCPICQHVFTAPASLEIKPAAPIPMPPPVDPAPPPRIERDRDQDDFDDREPRRYREDADANQGREMMSRGANWLMGAGIVFLLTTLFDVLFNITLNPMNQMPQQGPQLPQGMNLLLVSICSIVLFAIPIFFILLGAAQLRSAKSRGLVITGVVFDFILSAFYLFGLVCAVVAVGILPANFIWVIVLRTLIYGGTATVGIIAGIKTIALLGKDEVKEAFGDRIRRNRDWDEEEDEDDDWERRRRRRPRRDSEDD